MSITEKVAYLKGLAEGLKLDENDKSQKLISAIIDTLDEIAETIDEVADDVVDLADQVDAVDEDLAGLEEYVYDDDDDDDDFDDDEYYQVTCPTCNTEIYLDEDMYYDGEVECPECGSIVEFDVEECEDCDCDGECDGECEDCVE